jgi:hypothetical protein
VKTRPEIDPLVTNPVAASYARQQQTILDELRHAIHRGGKAGLEPLVWMIRSTGAIGEIDNITHGTKKARALFDAWVAVLGGERVENFPPNENGYTVSIARVASSLPADFTLGLTVKLSLSSSVIKDEQEGA